MAQEFLKWLGVPVNSAWLDVGCGTGALSQTILRTHDPNSVKGIDRSDGYVAYVQEQTNDPRASFGVGDAQSLPEQNETYDVAVSGFVLNFVPEPLKMVSEMKRAVRKSGMVALYVWDYAGRMQMMRHFWNAVQALDPDARELDEGRRFPLCNPDALRDLFQKVELNKVETRPIDIATEFKDFDDYWNPFLGGQGPAPGYAVSLSEEKRTELRERIRSSLPFALDGSVSLIARAWAVRGIK